MKSVQIRSLFWSVKKNRKKEKLDGYEGYVKDEYNVKKSRPLKSFKASLQNKKNCDKNKEKTISFLLTKMMTLTHIHTEIKPIVKSGDWNRF